MHDGCDLAFGKPVMDLCNHPEYLTDDTEEYGGNDSSAPNYKHGYLGTHWPTFITVDLLNVEKVGAICLKLWDWKDPLNIDPKKNTKQDMQYAYRLLASEDLFHWTVIFDCADVKDLKDKFRNGWQLFRLNNPLNIRYIRIHGLRNKFNSGFHPVKLKVFSDAQASLFQDLSKKNAVIDCKVNEQEEGEGSPLSFRLRNLAGQIQDINLLCGERIKELHKEDSEYHFFSSIKDMFNQFDVHLFKRAHEVEAIEREVDETRNLIAGPIRNEIEDEVKKEQYGFDIDFSFGMFQFLVVALLYYLSEPKKNYGQFFFWALVIFVVIYIFLRIYYKIANKADVRENSDFTEKPSVVSICDSDGEKWENGDKIEKRGISVLAQQAFWSKFDDSIDSLKYDENEGYHEILSPGWIEFKFDEVEDINYLRFLLWDNNGSSKRLPSHRVYNYRVTFRASEKEPWYVLHDTMGHGSRGWQEFINESKEPWRIRFVRIYGINNSGTLGAGKLLLVRFGISKDLYDLDLKHMPRNRIIKYVKLSEKRKKEELDITKILYCLKMRANNHSGWESKLKELDNAIKVDNIDELFLKKLREIADFVTRYINESYTDDYPEDFSMDVKALVLDTLKPVKNAKNMKKQLESWMLIPKTILVLAATGPMIKDCLETNINYAYFVLVIAIIMLVLVWINPIKKFYYWVINQFNNHIKHGRQF